MKAIEKNFPFEFIDNIAEMESYRKEINRPIYHIHKWWAKRLGSVFRAIGMGSIEQEWPNFYDTNFAKNKIVLDPFMGSGTTIGESLKLGYRAIGCDVNPVSTFLVNQALTKVDLSSLHDEFKAIEKDVAGQIKQYYKTQIDGAECDVLYFFWVKQVKIEDNNIPLFSSYIFSKNAYPKLKPNAKVVCPSCEAIFTCRYDSINETCPDCSTSFNPQNGPVKGSTVYDKNGKTYRIKDLLNASSLPPVHKLFAIMAITASGDKIYIKPKSDDFDLYLKATKKLKEIEDTLPLPSMSVRPGHNTNQAIGYNYF
ncbi:MAG: hypothetical protein EOO07_19475, partial [Chitinophagaceae bacterium]